MVRLYPDYRAAELDYFRRTRIFPIMHTVVIRKDVHERHPFVATSLYRALDAAKDMALEKMRYRGTLRYMLPLMHADIDEIDAVFGGDPWPYGIEANRPTLDALVRYLEEQGVIAKAPKVEELFVPIPGMHEGASTMKLASYIAGGKESYGVVVGDGVVTMTATPSCATRSRPARSTTCARRAAAATPDRKLADIRFLPAIPNPRKILCAGVNYRSHAAEVGRELPKQPSMFIRFTDTLVGHDGEMIRPRLSDNFDFEGELTMVIGKGGRHIPIERALDHVAGYTCFVDGSVRDYQKFSVTSGKNWPGHRPARTLDRHRRRDSRSRPADADHAAQRASRCSIPAPTS